jgi:succinylglutamate desuccinylase
MDALFTHFEISALAAMLVLAGSIAILFASLLLLRHLKTVQRQHDEIVVQLKRDMRALTKAAVSVGERVLEVERRQRQQQAESKEPIDIYDAANQPYEQAIRMAKNGAAQDELINVCGLSANEAELISMLHRWDKSA